MTLWKAASAPNRARPPTGVTARAGNLSGHGTEGAPSKLQPAQAGGGASRRAPILVTGDLMASADPQNASDLLRTPLHALHVELGARMVPFAGYDMPVQYPTGILTEHLHTRAAAGLFDVSHMGQALIEGPNHEASARALERLCPADLLNLAPGRQRYTQFLNKEGGIVDDLMVTRPVGADGRLFLVVNASRKGVDFDLLRANLPADIRLKVPDARALIALQGPQAAKALARLAADPSLETMPFMSARETSLLGAQANI
jgi:aminomethyltransferase